MKKSVRIVGALLLLPNLGLLAYIVYALTLPIRDFELRMGACAMLFVLIFITAVFVSCLMGKPVLKTHPMLSGVLLLTFGVFMFLKNDFSVAPLMFILAGAVCIAGLPGFSSGRRKEPPTMKKLSRILGVAGGALSLLPYLIYIAQCLYTLALPDSEAQYESKGYAGAFLLIFSLPALVSITGLIGSLLLHKKRFRYALLMLSDDKHQRRYLSQPLYVQKGEQKIEYK